MAKEKRKKKDKPLKVNNTFEEVIGIAVKGNPKPKKKE